MLIAFLLWETRKWIPSGINPSVNKKSQECAAGRVPTTQKGRVEAYAKKGSGILFLAAMSGMWNFPVCVCVHAPSCLTLCDPADWAHQAPLSMEFSRQKYWHGLPFPTSGDLPNPGIEPVSFGCPVLAGIFFSTAPPGKTMELPGPGIKSAAPNSGSAESSPLDQ